MLGVFCFPALRGGNCNNSTNAGAFYVNLNNTTSNTNWTIGAALFLSIDWIIMPLIFLAPWQK
jgi:hypothetical protein